MPVELIMPVELAPRPRVGASAWSSALRVVTVAMILASVSVVMLGRPGGTLADPRADPSQAMPIGP